MSDEIFVEGTGPPNTRYNIADFSTKEELNIQWSLYLRALNVLKLETDQSANPLSYFRIAAIHGKPILNWPRPGAGDHSAWCNHAAPTFLPWHRVYLYLYEKAIVDQAVILAQQIPDADKKKKYVAQARKIRQPYWDWADTQDMPAVMNGDTATVIKILDTDSTTIPNPLQSYTFPSEPETPWGPKTTRYSDAVVKANLIRFKIRETVYKALTASTVTPMDGFGAFSNKAYPKPTASIETSHDLGHAIGEYMADNDRASFDPIFWFHHANVDRYYALWQAMNPLKPWQENGSGNTVGDMLPPFRRPAPDGDWRSRMVQYVDSSYFPNYFQFGVQYPEILSTDTESDQLAKSVEAVHRLYSPKAFPVTQPAAGKPVFHYPEGCVPRSSWKGTNGYPPALPNEAGVRQEWQVNIAVKNDLIPGNFTVFVFLGEPGSPSEWGTNNATVGALYTFKATLETCKGCQDRKGEYYHSAIYLTEDLHRLVPPTANFGDVSPVSEFLNKELSWRIRKADGTEYQLPEGDTTSLTVTVVSYVEAYPPVDEKGKSLTTHLVDIVGVTYGHKEHPEITEGAPNYH